MSWYPVRSPLAIVDAMRDYITGMVVCEIGCNEGDLMVLMQNYARKVIGIEVEDYRSIWKQKGLNVIWGDARQGVPKADVYYVWVGEIMLNDVLNKIESGLIMIGYNPGTDNQQSHSLLMGVSKEIAVDFTEGNVSGKFYISLVPR